MKNKSLLLFLIFIIALLPRLYRLDSRSAWMDEGKQATLASASPMDFSMAGRAAMQQQPPLDYVLESIGLRNFGANETGMRIHAAILGALAALFFFLLIGSLTGRRWLVFTGTGIFIFHPFLLKYSQEGRPISCAVFFSVLFLYLLWSYLENRPGSFPLPIWGVLLTLVQTGFILSAGFQPLIFPATVSVCLIPYLFIKKERRQKGKRVLIAWLSTLVAFLAAFPVLKLTIATGVRFNFVKQETAKGVIVNLLDGINQFISQGIGQLSLHDFIYFYRVSLQDYGVLFIAMAVAAGAGYFLTRKDRREKNLPSFSSRRSPGLWFFSLFFAVSPILFFMAFRSLIAWRITPRYFLSFVPAILIVLLLLMDKAADAATVLPRMFRRVKITPAIVSITILLAGYSIYSNIDSVSGVYAEKKAEWNKMYDLFKYDSRPGDTAYMLNLVPKGSYSPFFRAKSLYYPAALPRPVVLKRASDLPADLKRAKKGVRGSWVYLVTRYGWKKIKASYFAGIQNIEVHLFHGLSVLKLREISQINRVLQILKTKLRDQRNNYIIYRLLDTIGPGAKKQSKLNFEL